MDSLLMLTCDNCKGKLWAGGIYPRKGKTRGDLMDEIRSKGKTHAICRHCGRVSVLRVVPLDADGRKQDGGGQYSCHPLF